jgi:hypothetical protein
MAQMAIEAASSTICKTVCPDLIPPLNLGTAQIPAVKDAALETVIRPAPGSERRLCRPRAISRPS